MSRLDQRERSREKWGVSTMALALAVFAAGAAHAGDQGADESSGQTVPPAPAAAPAAPPLPYAACAAVLPERKALAAAGFEAMYAPIPAASAVR